MSQLSLDVIGFDESVVSIIIGSDESSLSNIILVRHHFLWCNTPAIPHTWRVQLCTGAGPAKPSLRGLSGVPHWTYRDVFQATEVPRSMIIIGAGPVGCELG